MEQVQNDKSLLRPFDIEKAKSGESICWSYLDEDVKYIGVFSNGEIAYESGEQNYFATQNNFRMKPLAWVEGKPVYKGDVLYSNFFKGEFEVTGIDCYGQFKAEKNRKLCGLTKFESCSWNKPKTKRTVYVNVCPWSSAYYYESKEIADEFKKNFCVICQTTMEIEE